MLLQRRSRQAHIGDQRYDAEMSFAKALCFVCGLADLLMILTLVTNFGSDSSVERPSQTSSAEQTHYYSSPDELLRQLRQLQPIEYDSPIRRLKTPALVELAQADTAR
jgi:hypothetical protein